MKSFQPVTLSENRKLMSKAGTRHEGKGNLVHPSACYFVFLEVKGIKHIHPLPEVAGKWSGRLSASQPQRPGERLGSHGLCAESVPLV